MYEHTNHFLLFYFFYLFVCLFYHHYQHDVHRYENHHHYFNVNVGKECESKQLCFSASDPQDILLRKQPPAMTASFYQRMQFLIEEESVQSFAQKMAFNDRYVVIWFIFFCFPVANPYKANYSFRPFFILSNAS